MLQHYPILLTKSIIDPKEDCEIKRKQNTREEN